jgi:GNAT superfamily N-acetyltransferase
LIEIKRLTECTIDDSVTAWNEGFQGYYFDATTTPENFIKRMVLEDLSPTLSIIAFQDKQPIGIVLNGIREVDGRKVAWNGGTGVSQELRSKGVGKLLIEHTLSILKEEGVDFATLEAISDNQKAIALYEKMGYQVVDNLEYLELTGILTGSPPVLLAAEYTIEETVPQRIGSLPFYKGMNPWQTQWQSAKDGRAIVVKDRNGAAIGYAYYRQTFNNGIHEATTLFQCEAEPGRTDAEKIVRTMLGKIYGTFNDEIKRVIPNIPVSKSEITYSVLKELGFKPIAKQVFMIKEM